MTDLLLKRWPVVAVLLMALTGCDGGVTDSSRSGVASVSISPASKSAEVGASVQLEAIVKDANGNPLPGRQVFWASNDTSVAIVTPSGVVIARSPGSAQIAASAERQSGFASIVVVSRAPASVVIQPGSSTLTSLSDTVHFTAVARDANGNLLTGRTVTWSSSAAGFAAVSSSGVATAVANGVATIVAEIDGVKGTATLTVAQRVASVTVAPQSVALPLGDSARLSASAVDAKGFPVAGASVAWGSSNTIVAPVSASGVVSGSSTGEATVTASAGGVIGTSSIAVALTPVGSVEVAPSTRTVAAGETVQMTATVRDERGNVLPGRVVSWSSSDRAVASVDSTGRVTGQGAGTATIGASAGGKTGTATITVPVPPPAAVASVAVSSPPGNIPVGATYQLTVTLRDANGNVLTGRQVSWSSANTAIATVDQRGVVTGVSGGSTTITATAEGKTGSTEVRVAAAPVASVEVTPATASVSAGATTQLTARPRDANGNLLSGRSVSWTSSNTSVATVSGSGLVTGVAPGSATITATSEGQSGTASVSVVAVAVSSVSVSPASASVSAGGSTQLTATARDANNNVLSGRSFTWTSDSPAVATVDGNGLVRGVAPGTAKITATSEGKSGSASITVTVPAVATVAVSPASQTRQVGQSAQYSAELRDAAGNVLTGRAVSWSSSNPAVASVNSTGLVQALAPGEVTITATSEGKNGTAAFTATPVPVATVEVTPKEARIAPGEGVQLAAVLRDANNNVLTGRTVTWTSSNVTVATVDGNGAVRALAPGKATITATAEGKSGTAAIAVNFGSLSSVSVSPASQTAQVGSTLQYNATLKDAAGNVVTGTSVDWSSSAPAVASVNNTGQVRGVAPGTANIVAAAEGKADTAVAIITAGPPASLRKVSGDNQEGNVGQPLPSPLVVRVTDAFGNPVPNVRVSWAVLSPNGQVSPSSSTTDASGRASTTWTLGSGPKNQSAQASVAGLSPVTFSARR